MMRGLGLSLLVGLCAACGDNADNDLFDSANGAGGDPAGAGGSTNASGGTNGNGDPTGGSGGKSGTGSGGTTNTAGTANASGGSSGGLSSGGSGGGTAGGPGGGGKGSRDCNMLIDDAYEALSKARACDPSTDVPHCTGFVEDPCGCSVAVEQPDSQQVRAYAAALEQMEKAGCSIACLAIVCFEPVGGVCHENGSC